MWYASGIRSYVVPLGNVGIFLGSVGGGEYFGTASCILYIFFWGGVYFDVHSMSWVYAESWFGVSF